MVCFLRIGCLGGLVFGGKFGYKEVAVSPAMRRMWWTNTLAIFFTSFWYSRERGLKEFLVEYYLTISDETLGYALIAPQVILLVLAIGDCLQRVFNVDEDTAV